MSERFIAADAARWCDAALAGAGDTAFSSASIDSRATPAGALFVAIPGPRHDGHDHLPGTLESGAAGWVVERGRALPAHPDGFPVLTVDDTTRALGDIAAGHRARFQGPVIAITGSNGKTTTKEILAAALGGAGRVLKTEGNLNNHYGLPLTLLRREGDEDFLVVELGTNHPGEIARLAEIACPTIGVLTNVGTAHIEFLGSREGIGSEKGALVAALGAEHTAILNADDPHVMAQAGRTQGRVLTFGVESPADLRAEAVRWEHGAFRFTLCTPQGEQPVRIVGLGDTTIPNGLAAAGAALAAGASLAQVAEGLAAYRPIAGRLAPRALEDDVLVIDDTYNANPQSMEASLRMLATSAACASGRRIAVLGDMGELGSETEKAHRETGALVATLGLDRLLAVGACAAEVAAGAREAGLAEAAISSHIDTEEASQRLARELSPGDRILVKGSRSMRMERIVEHVAASRGEAH
jgi:UDP-N-acetylmuramoyl-tripeptide--D-alanyl-D-alanine ligase